MSDESGHFIPAALEIKTAEAPRMYEVYYTLFFGQGLFLSSCVVSNLDRVVLNLNARDFPHTKKHNLTRVSPHTMKYWLFHMSTPSSYHPELLKVFLVGNSTKVESFDWEITLKNFQHRGTSPTRKRPTPGTPLGP